MRASSFDVGDVGIGQVLRRLQSPGPLPMEDIDLILAHHEPVAPHVTGAVLGGDAVFLAAGWACKARIFADGRRQILGFLLPGDPVDLAHERGPRHYCTMALTRGTTVDLGPAIRRLREAGEAHPELDLALAQAARARVTRGLDHLARLTALNAYQAMCDLLLDLHAHGSALGLASGDALQLPISQDVLGEALGLSVVHTNRILSQLRRQGMIELTPGCVILSDRDALSAVVEPRKTEHAHK